ncbi:ribonuclease H-like domain-containing protein [Paenibacillus arenilitoris]|uniref:Ribonuclease H-like domain-containing protein n=1 Tax=Paenibacillus arenilitoris TaxID=2772299 RepID=A0A927CQI9_9BACL|nr:ribonuclease H-like domain-containing protein [Paenibacillus arenilitoris]MBD2869815.1 ribonuclease H-like domain-containing protein [Paenibacillus arenilitoris]
MSGLKDRMMRLRGHSSEAPADRKTEEPASASAAIDSEETDRRAADSSDDGLSPVWDRIGVKLLTNDAGSFLLRKVDYPADYRHGLHAIEELRQAAPGLSAFHPGANASAEQVLFLDLETTGLGVGTGNVPFMLGIAYEAQGRFTIEQALIRHPAEERAMLAYLAEKLPKFTYLATYNGKTFDWPLVQSRFIMNGLGRNVWEPRHLDFLHPARSVWRNTLASCKLSYVEEERLGIHREDDVPGSLAPQLYFQFLADGDPSPLAGVFRHNEIDMLSLAALAIRFGHLLNGRFQPFIPLPKEPEELVRTGLWLEKMGIPALPEQLFELAARTEEANPATLLMLAARDKKAGNWARAVLLWQKTVLRALSNYGAAAMEANIELAMYYEHKLKDFDSALGYADAAFEHATNQAMLVRRDAKKRAELEALRNRIARLRRKAEAATARRAEPATFLGEELL